MRVYPILNHSPTQVLSALIEKHGSAFRPTILPVGKRLVREGRYRPVIFILTSEDFERNLTATRKLDHDFYVFGSDIVLQFYGLKAIDLNGIDLDAEPQRPRVVPKSNYIDELIKLARVGSLFDDLMTLIYKLPSKTQQRPVTNVCCLWLYEGRRISDLEKMFKALDVKIKQSVVDEVEYLLSQDVASRIQQALSAYRSQGLSLESCSIKFKVQKFELSYVIGNVEKSESLIDIKVANQGVG